MGDKHLTVAEAAQLLRMSETSVKRRARQLGGFKLPGCRRWLFDAKELKQRRCYG